MLSHFGLHDAAQQIVDDRIARAQRQREIHRALRERRARERFQRSVGQGLRDGLGPSELSAQMWRVIRKQQEA